MGNVSHFSPNDDGAVACGARVYLCDEYTDEPKYVDCGRCKRTKAFKNHDPRRFDVDVWDHAGNIVRYSRRVTTEEVEAVQREYGDDLTVEIVVHEV